MYNSVFHWILRIKVRTINALCLRCTGGSHAGRPCRVAPRHHRMCMCSCVRLSTIVLP